MCDSSMPTSPPELEVAPACEGMARTQLATPPSVAPPSQQLGVVAAYPTLMVDEITPTTRSAGAAGLAAFHADRVAARPGYDSTENPLADAERPPNTTELFPHCNLQLGIAKPGEPAFDLPASSPDVGKRVAAYYWWLFPNTMLNVYPWGVSVNVVKPLAVDRTRVSFLSYVWDESKLDRGAGSTVAMAFMSPGPVDYT